MRKAWFILVLLSLSMILLVSTTVPAKAPDQTHLVILKEHFVVVDSGKAEFLSRYCKATNIPIVHVKKIMKAGPFLSAYEVGWLAAHTPHARVESRTPFSQVKDPIAPTLLEAMIKASPLNIDDSLKLDKVQVLEAGQMQIGEHVLWRLKWEKVQGAISEAFFLVKNSRPYLIAEELWYDPYLESFGLGMLEREGIAPAFLIIENGPRGSGEKTEGLAIWVFGEGEKRQSMAKFEEFTQFLGGLDPDDPSIRFRSSRVSIDSKDLKIKHFEVDAVAVNPQSCWKCAVSEGEKSD